MDRQIIGVLKPELSKDFNWNEIDYSNIVFWFQVAYAIGYAGGGWFMDRVGVRRGYSLAVFFWSLAAMAHALVWFVPAPAKLNLWLTIMPSSVVGFCAARFALGLSEGGNFPASIKGVSEWFPKKERAFATGLFNSGSNIGAILTPLAIPWVTVHLGWPFAFFVTGALGFLWLGLWLWSYRAPERHPKVTTEELTYIRSDPPDPAIKIPWRRLLRYRAVWAFIVGTALTSPIWWFYLYWIPDFMKKTYSLDLITMGLPVVAIYLISDAGSIGGGWLSSRLIKQGWSINAARKTALLVCALCVVPVFLATRGYGEWVVVMLIGLAAAGHQGFSANLFTLVSDMMPRYAVSSVVGLGGMCGAIGGMFFAKLVGYVLQWTHSYAVLFVIASGAYLLALLLIHLLVPRLEPVTVEAYPDARP
jgi:ACS family hexuronate transporter-like MFS transporter